MKYLIEILKCIGTVILGFTLFILVIIFCAFPFMNNCYKGNEIYEYEDIDENKGTASNCQFSDADNYYRKGGQGQPICFIGNKVIVVKWYENKTEYMNCFKCLWR